MTTGNLTLNRMVDVSTSSGPGKIGSYYNRNWFGGDRPKVPNGLYQKQFHTETTYIPQKPIYVKSVEWKLVPIRLSSRKVVWKRIRVVHRRMVERPPKVKTRLRYTKVANPKPPKPVPDEHSYNCSISQYTDAILSYKYVYRANGDAFNYTGTTMNTFGGLSYIDNWDSNDDLAMLSRLRTKVAGSDFNLGVFLAEGGEAMRMIGNAAFRIDKAYRNLKRGNFLGAARALIDGPVKGKFSSKKSISSNWLEMQYGWLPLLQDAEAGAQFLAHMHSTQAGSTVRVSRSRPLISSWANSPAYVEFGFSGTHIKAIKAIYHETSPAQLSGLLDPLSVIWERLPYSFVADWFIPIGSYLSARALSTALSGTFVTTDFKKAKHGGFAYKPTSGIPYYSGASVGYSSLRVDVVRTVSNNLSVPLPSFKPLDKVASWRHMANAVSLLVQRHGS